jgi:Flp pilus assembly protein TadD
MPARRVSRVVLSRLLVSALAGALGASAGCASKVVDTGAGAEMGYGAKMAKQGFWHEALFRFLRASAEKPNDAEIQNNLAVAYEAVGETSKALAAYRRALELAPEETHIRRNYARFAEYYTASQRAGSGTEAAPLPSPTPHP